MKSRCNNPKNNRFYRYGARGIVYTEEWENFPAFANWATQSGFKDGLTLDRIDNNGNYCPENCRWVTPAKNTRNSTVAKLTEASVSEIKNLLEKNVPKREIALMFGVHVRTVFYIDSGHIWKEV